MDQKLRRLLYPVTAASMLLVMSGVGHAHAAQVQQGTKPSVTPHITATMDKANQPSNIKSGQQTQTASTKPSVGQAGSGDQKITDQTKSNKVSKGQQAGQSDNVKEEAIKKASEDVMPDDGVGGQGEPGHTSETSQQYAQVEADYMKDIDQYQLSNQQKTAFANDALTVVHNYAKSKEVPVDPLWKDWLHDFLNYGRDFNMGLDPHSMKDPVTADSGLNMNDDLNNYERDYNKLSKSDQSKVMSPLLLKFLQISDTLTPEQVYSLSQQKYDLAEQARNMDSGMATVGIGDTGVIPGGYSQGLVSDCPDGEVAGSIKDPYIPADLQAKIRFLRDIAGSSPSYNPDSHYHTPGTAWSGDEEPDYEPFGPIKWNWSHDIINRSTNNPITPAEVKSNEEKEYHEQKLQMLADKEVKADYDTLTNKDLKLKPIHQVGPDNMGEYVEPYWIYNGKQINNWSGLGTGQIDDEGKPSGHPWEFSSYGIPNDSNYIDVFVGVDEDYRLPILQRKHFHDLVTQAMGPFWDSDSSNVERSLAHMINQLSQSKYGKTIPGTELQNDLPRGEFEDNQYFNSYARSHDQDPVDSNIDYEDANSVGDIPTDKTALVSGLPGTYQTENTICQNILNDTNIPESFRSKFGDLYNYWAQNSSNDKPSLSFEPDSNPVSIDELADNDYPDLQGIIGQKAYNSFKKSEAAKNKANNTHSSGSASGQSNSGSTGSKSALKPSGSTSDSGSASKPSNSGASGSQSSSLPNGNSAASGSGETPNTNPMNSNGSSSSIPTSNGSGFEPNSGNTSNFVPTDSGDVNPDIPSVNPYTPNSVSPDNTTVNPITGDVTNPNAANTDGYTPVQSAETNGPSANTSSSPSVDNDGNASTDTDNSNDDGSNLSPMDTDNNGNASSNLIKSSGMLGNNSLNTTAQAIHFSGMNLSNVMNTDSVANNASIVSGNTDNQTTLPQTGEVSEDAYIALGLMLFSFGLVFDIRRRIS